MLLFFSNEFSVIYMYLLKNLNNFELMDKQEAIILVLTVYLILSLSRELEHLEKKNYSILLHTKNRQHHAKEEPRRFTSSGDIDHRISSTDRKVI